MFEYQPVSEFRKDIVSNDWILVVTGRRNRPNAERIKNTPRKPTPKKGCPFENPQKSGGEFPLLWFPNSKRSASENIQDWFLQVVPNKFPALTPHHVCPKEGSVGPYFTMNGIGFHEVIITRDHERSIADMNHDEVELVLRSYQERYLTIEQEPCIEYVLVFHNHGPKAGASILHPHSQLIALPIIPPDVLSSLEGSKRYFDKHKTCVHCAMIKFEEKEKKRIVYENKKFIVFAPFAPRVSYEIRLFPKKHSAHFEDIIKEDRRDLADALKITLSKLKKALRDPDYNFFIHTAPAKSDGRDHYHWHFEILPRIAIWAGVELGTGIEVVAVPPEEAAEELNKV